VFVLDQTDGFFLFSLFFFFSSRRRHTRSKRDWSSDVCSSDLSPLFTVLVYSIAFRVHYSSTVYYSLLPLTIGVMLACSSQSTSRSEERRVGKECRSRWWTYY